MMNRPHRNNRSSPEYEVIEKEIPWLHLWKHQKENGHLIRYYPGCGKNIPEDKIVELGYFIPEAQAKELWKNSKQLLECDIENEALKEKIKELLIFKNERKMMIEFTGGLINEVQEENAKLKEKIKELEVKIPASFTSFHRR